MTGRDLILYILSNNLEDKLVYEDGVFLGFVRPSEVAVKHNVGINTIYAYMALGQIDYIVIGGETFIPANFKLKNE